MAKNTNQKSKILSDMETKWKRVDDVWGGTDAMRVAGEEYLYRNPLESQYADRLRRATLNDAFQRTIKKGVGKAFASSMEVVLPTQLEYLELNCDRSGTSLQTFTKTVLEETLKYGVYYILVDTPDTEVNSLYEQELFNVKPYFVGIKPLQVSIIESDIINNELMLIHFKYTFNVDESVFTAEYLLEENSVRFILSEVDVDGRETQVQDININIPRIPIVPIYGNKVAPYVGQPVLNELVHLVLKHYWKQSELDWNEHFGLTPILQMAGADSQVNSDTGEDDMQDFILGASTLVKTHTQGDVKWTVADSAGIKTGQESLDRLLKEIENAGLELTVKTEAAETATGRRLDAAEANSILKSIVLDLEWSIYQAILIAGYYLNTDAEDADINLDTASTVDSATDVQMIIQLFKEGLLTLAEARMEIKAMRFLSNETVVEQLDTVPETVIVQSV